MNCDMCKLEFEDTENDLALMLFHKIIRHGDQVNKYEQNSFGNMEDLR